MYLCKLNIIKQFSSDQHDRIPFNLQESGNQFIRVHWENYISISFQIEWDMIMVTVFLSILNQMNFHLVQNRKENCHHDHISFNLKGNGNIVFSVCATYTRSFGRILSGVKAADDLANSKLIGTGRAKNF